ncbi:MAG: fatty acyl-AMP ligase [Legionellales bacterium]
MDTHSSYQSLLALLDSLAEKTPERDMYTFIGDDGQVVATLNCHEIWLRAQQIAHGLLVRHHLSPGDCVLLVYPPGLAFVEALLGCLYAGIIPVPVPPPMPVNPEAGLSGYTARAIDCKAVAQLTNEPYSTSRTFGRIRQALTFGTKWPKLPWIVTDRLHGDASVPPLVAKENDIAFLQYTSGSTRAPRGVCITYGNIWDQIVLNRVELDMSAEARSLIWMPHYHDFTLISGILNAAAGNNQLIMFSPMGFLRRPALWGELLHRFQATHTAAPDFGYKLFTQRTTAEERAAWDLSSLRVVMSAAEPIHAHTVDAFLNSFASSGLNPAAFCPAYGLAEHTVTVSVWGRQRFQVDRDALEQQLLLKPAGKHVPSIELFGCGAPSRGVDLQIVDPIHLTPLPCDQIGEIWVNSPSKAQGYFSHPDETAFKFAARLTQELTENTTTAPSWLRTGDLGALYHGEIVVVGRLDDMIVLGGRNVFPQDIEYIIGSCDPRIKPGRVIAFGTQSLAEQESELVAVFELRAQSPNSSELSAVGQIIRVSLQQELGLTKITLVFAQQGSVPKTTSGKLQRKKCCADWMSGIIPCLKVDRGVFGSL